MSKYNVGIIQMDTQSNLDENIEQALKLIDEAVLRGAQLVALPENYNYLGDSIVPETIPGKSTIALMEKAKEKKIFIHCGSVTEKNHTGGLPYNTSVLIDDDGNIIAKYRKLHMFDINAQGSTSYESYTRSAGDEIVTVQTEKFGHLGFSICYDIRFPEIYRLMALKGAEVIFTPANFLMNTGKTHWEPILRARAIENGCYIIAPGQYGKKEKNFSNGDSMVIDPWGNIIARANEGVGVAIAQIDLDYVKKIRYQLPCLENRRTDIYDLKTI